MFTGRVRPFASSFPPDRPRQPERVVSERPRQPSPPGTPEDRLEQYLDRRLPPPEKDAFEDVLRNSANQRAQVRVQQAINASLARLFENGAVGAGSAAPVDEQAGD